MSRLGHTVRNEPNVSIADCGQTCGRRPAQADCAKQTQLARTNHAKQSQSGRVAGRPRNPPGANYAKQSQFRATPAGTGPGGCGTRVLYEQTQLAAGTGRPSPAPRPSGLTSRPTDCAKQTQFGPGPGEGQVLYEQGVMVNRTFDRLRQNKANLPRGAWKTIAKARGLDAATHYVGNRAKQSQFPSDRALRGPILRNKASSRRGWVGRGRGTRGVGLRYKQTQFLPLCRSGDRRSREPAARLTGFDSERTIFRVPVRSAGFSRKDRLKAGLRTKSN
jgi:hypothetical protein